MKKEVEIDDILELVACADDYGFNTPMLMSALCDMCKPLEIQDLVDHAQTFYGDQQGYCDEDREEIQSILIEWYGKYNRDV